MLWCMRSTSVGIQWFYCSQAPLCGSLFLSWTFSCVLLLPSKIRFLVICTVYFCTYYGSAICSECLLLGFCFTHCSNTLFFSVALFFLTFPVAPFLWDCFCGKGDTCIKGQTFLKWTLQNQPIYNYKWKHTHTNIKHRFLKI